MKIKKIHLPKIYILSSLLLNILIFSFVDQKYPGWSIFFLVLGTVLSFINLLWFIFSFLLKNDQCEFLFFRFLNKVNPIWGDFPNDKYFYTKSNSTYQHANRIEVYVFHKFYFKTIGHVDGFKRNPLERNRELVNRIIINYQNKSKTSSFDGILHDKWKRKANLDKLLKKK